MLRCRADVHVLASASAQYVIHGLVALMLASTTALLAPFLKCTRSVRLSLAAKPTGAVNSSKQGKNQRWSLLQRIWLHLMISPGFTKT